MNRSSSHFRTIFVHALGVRCAGVDRASIMRWTGSFVWNSHAITSTLQMIYNLIFPHWQDRGYTSRGMGSRMELRADGRREWSRDYVVVVENHFFEPLHQHAS